MLLIIQDWCMKFGVRAIQTGVIQFPRQGAEDLVNQLVGFGIEGHDDLSDAFAMAVIRSSEIMGEDRDWDVWTKKVEEWGGMGV